jgi:hypothetical protein
MLISTNIASIRLTERTEDIDKLEDKALAYTKEIVQGIYTIEKDTKKAKKIKDSDKRSAMSMTN